MLKVEILYLLNYLDLNFQLKNYLACHFQGFRFHRQILILKLPNFKGFEFKIAKFKIENRTY